MIPEHDIYFQQLSPLPETDMSKRQREYLLS